MATNALQYLQLSAEELFDQCEMQNFRASGPGGQHRNKTSSAVRLCHRPSGLRAEAVEDRSQHVNKKKALKRLRLTIAVELVGTTIASDYAPSEVLSARMQRNGQLKITLRHEGDFLIVNELLSVLLTCQGQVSDAARLVGISTANFVKCLLVDPKVWQKANQFRQQFGLHTLRAGSS